MAEEVNERTADIENVSEALFSEWEQEITQYNSASLKRNSQKKLNDTKAHYLQLISSIKAAEAKIEPILRVFNDQVMYLKRNYSPHIL